MKPARPTTSDATALFQHAAQIGSACSSPKRLQLLMLLSQAPKTVGQLAAQVGQSVAAASAHLQALKRGCLVSAHREGQQIRYELASPEVYTLLSALLATGVTLLPAAEQLADNHLRNTDSVSATPMSQIHDDITHDRVTVLDLRPADEFAAGHLPKARNIPHRELNNRLEEVPQRRRVVAYCRGPFCLSGIDAVNAARNTGHNIKRLPFGVNEWRDAGLPLETND
ncbi:MAG: metalloregulator ArsR/SmtB family transcription factor [Algisphaera sp.]